MALRLLCVSSGHVERGGEGGREAGTGERTAGGGKKVLASTSKVSSVFKMGRKGRKEREIGAQKAGDLESEIAELLLSRAPQDHKAPWLGFAMSGSPVRSFQHS